MVFTGQGIATGLRRGRAGASLGAADALGGGYVGIETRCAGFIYDTQAARPTAGLYRDSSAALPYNPLSGGVVVRGYAAMAGYAYGPGTRSR